MFLKMFLKFSKNINFLILFNILLLLPNCTNIKNNTVNFNSIILEEKENFNYKKFQNKDELAKNFLMAYETIISFFVNPGIENLSIMDRFITTR